MLRDQQGYRDIRGTPRGCRGHWGPSEALGISGGVRGALGAGRECRVQGPEGYRMLVGGIGVSRVHWGVAGGLGTQPHWSQSRVQHSHWFPLGSDLPHQGQAMAPVEGPITPTSFPRGVTYLAKAKQVTEMSSAGYYIHLALYL